MTGAGPPTVVDTHTQGTVHTPILIEPQRGWQPLDLPELWRYRELLGMLALRDLQVRYKQTVLGAAWAIIQPVFMMLVFTIFFGKLGGMNKEISGSAPYYVQTFCALLPWQLFASAMTNAGNSLIGNQNLLTKIYFPRLVLPISSILSDLVDFFIAFVILIAMLLFNGLVPGPAVFALPLLIVLAFVTALGAGMWLSALNVEYRDIRYVIPFLSQFWLFASPVIYPASLIPERWRWAYGLNPMVGVIEGFRWALLSDVPAPGVVIWMSALVSITLLLGGAYYFRRMEENFADRV